MVSKDRVGVLFVCMGNICRSPTAHGIFRDLVKQKDLSHLIDVESAGTHAYHIGNPPDSRSIETALNHGVNLNSLRALQVNKAHFYDYDYILAMDEDNLSILERIKPADSQCHLSLLLDFTENGEVPDPYYGGQGGFERVYNMVEKACIALLDHLLK